MQWLLTSINCIFIHNPLPATWTKIQLRLLWNFVTATDSRQQ